MDNWGTPNKSQPGKTWETLKEIREEKLPPCQKMASPLKEFPNKTPLQKWSPLKIAFLNGIQLTQGS